MEFKFRLGDRLRDKISGFEGIATVRAQYLNGCEQYLLKPQGLKEDGDIKDGYYFDSQQLVLVGYGILVEQTFTGGPKTIS